MHLFKKKIHIIYILCILLIIVIGIGFNIKPQIIIVFDNKTDFSIENLKLNYTGLEQEIEIPCIQNNTLLEYNLILNNDFQEGCVEISYVDSNSTVQTYTLIGYLEKGYHGTVNVLITSVGTDLEFKIQENIQI